MLVRDLMSTAVQTCRTTDTLNKAAALMWHHAIGIVPVLDEDDRPVAVITDRDVAMAGFLTGRRLSELSVSQSMSQALFTCSAGEPLHAAQARMAAHHVRRLPVLDDAGALCGVLSTDDLIRAAASGWRLFAAPELVQALQGVVYPPPVADSSDTPASADEEGAAPTGFWERWQGGLGQLQQRRDELRLALHLASMDARQEWEGLESRLSDLQQRAQGAEKRLEGELQHALGELSDGYQRLRERLTPPPAEE